VTFLSQDAKKLLNNIKCPICKGPIDMISYFWRPNKDFNFGCANDYKHYSLALRHDELPILITAERVHVYDGNKKYQLNKKYSDNTVSTEIVIYRIDPEGREIFTFEQKRLLLEKDLFDFAHFNNEKAVQRIKTILLFY
jgi:hypothetical protein